MRTVLLLLAIAIVAVPLARAQNGDVPRVHVDPPTVGPAYAPELIRRVVRRHRAALTACTAGHPSVLVRGVDLTIGPDGSVTAASIDLEPTDTGIEQCAAREMRSWRFPVPPGGASVHVHYPGVDGRF